MADILDYKKEYKDLYLPKTEPSIIKVPEIIFAAVDGKGNPNDPDGEYQAAVGILYGIQYTIKMSKKGTSVPKGYFDYVVPPLEGLWWLDTNEDWPPKSKSTYNWVSMIRLPEYVNKDVFERAGEEAAKKKKIDTGKAYLYKFSEGLCVQCMHMGPFDDEPQTLARMEDFLGMNGLIKDLSDKRRHHEIYLSNPEKIAPQKMETVLRIPVRKG